MIRHRAGSGLHMAAAAALLAALAAAGARAAEVDGPPGDPFRDCAVCPEMIPLPTGAFAMGSDVLRAAGPPRPVRITDAFAIARTETTWDQYQACVEAGACRGGQDDHGWGRGDRPVINLTIADARAYAAWLSAVTGRSYRLPSEAEWEWAARAGTTTPYPWGDAMEEGRASCRGCDGPVVEHAGTTPVGAWPANAWGLHDMNGNLWEMTADCWTPRHPPDASQAPTVTEPCADHVMRGGAWYYVPAQSSSAARQRNPDAVWSYVVGFRVVRDMAPR